MRILLMGTALFLAAGLILHGLVWIALRIRRRQTPARFWARTARRHVVLIPVYLFLFVPAVMGWMAASLVGTRGDERAYAGPCIDSVGRWHVQTRESLLANEGCAAAPETDEHGLRHAVFFPSLDDTSLRAFWVQGPGAPRALTAICVHGLFRGALEIDAVGAMFHDLGLHVLLLELRNHGGSGRTAFSGGEDESLDVEAAARWVRRQPGHDADGILVFGVSLGTSAVSLAAPRIDGLVALVLDAPLSDFGATADRLLAPDPDGPRRIHLPQPFRSTTLFAYELFSGTSLDDIRPRASLARLRPTLPILVIGGEDDRNMPPDEVRALYEGLPQPKGTKELWIRPGSGHGKVWIDDPVEYRRRLETLVRRI